MPMLILMEVENSSYSNSKLRLIYTHVKFKDKVLYGKFEKTRKLHEEHTQKLFSLSSRSVEHFLGQKLYSNRKFQKVQESLRNSPHFLVV